MDTNKLSTEDIRHALKDMLYFAVAMEATKLTTATRQADQRALANSIVNKLQSK